jgi:RNA recognition motif-containing protein
VEVRSFSEPAARMDTQSFLVMTSVEQKEFTTRGRQPSFDMRSSHSPCMVKNTFIEIPLDGQTDSYGEFVTLSSRRRQASEPPLNRRELDYNEYRHRLYEQQLQAGQAEIVASSKQRVADIEVSVVCQTPSPPSSECEDINTMEFALHPLPSPSQVCPSDDSSTSTCHPSSGLSMRQYSGNTADEQDFEADLSYHQLWIPGCMISPHMMHPGVAMHAEVDAYEVPIQPETYDMQVPQVDGYDGRVDNYDGMAEGCEVCVEEDLELDCAEGDGQWRQQGVRERRRRTRIDPMLWDDGVVTVMVRQIPRRYTQLMFLKEVNRGGFEKLFDFLYLPYDFKKGINVGYGFINFISHQHAQQFRKEFDGSYIDRQTRMRGKPLRVHPASVQGYEANYTHFMQTKTGQKQDPQFSPLFFRKETVQEESACEIPAPWCGSEQHFHSPTAPGYFVPTLMECSVKEEPEAEQSSRQSSKQNSKIELEDAGPTCPSCGAPHRSEHNFCARCGHRLGSSPVVVKSSSNSRGGKDGPQQQVPAKASADAKRAPRFGGKK